jgi:hypothetical protein
MSQALAKGGVDPAKTRTAWEELGQLNNKYGELALDASLAAGGALPPPFGTVADIASLGKSIYTGDWGGALFDVVGLVPIAGDAAKAGKIANKLNDLRRALDTAAAGLNRSLQRTKEIAAKYWDDIAKKNRAEYEKAIKKCTTQECRQQAALLKGPQYGSTPKDGSNGTWQGERGDGTWVPADGSPPIKYKNGFPDYSPFSKGDVDIPMRGNRTSDFTNADKAMREKLGDPNWTRPSDYTWHHHENGTTMQLIPKNIHATGGGATTPHLGGASLYSGQQAGEF